MSTTSTGNGRELSNLAKIYKKYSGHNNSLTIKLAIFYDIYFKTNDLLQAKMKIFLIILKAPTLDNYCSNIGINGTIINFD